MRAPLWNYLDNNAYIYIYMFFCYLFMHLVYCFKATLPVCVQVIPLEFSYVQSPYFDALMGL